MFMNFKSIKQNERKIKTIRSEEDVNCTNVISFIVST